MLKNARGSENETGMISKRMNYYKNVVNLVSKRVFQGELRCTPKQIEARRTNARARYANLTPE